MVRRDNLVAVSYGRKAADDYQDMDESQRADYLLFSRFKMCLYQAASYAPDSLMARAICGTEKPAIKVRLSAGSVAQDCCVICCVHGCDSMSDSPICVRMLHYVQVFASALHYIRLRLVDYINKSIPGTPIDNSDIRWVLTVPCIWSDAAKNVMRQAAKQAGLFTTPRPDQLMLALEPEAAALSCNADLRDQKRQLPGGSKYLVLDCGGTVVWW
jgi:hypothetical protein